MCGYFVCRKDSGTATLNYTHTLYHNPLQSFQLHKVENTVHTAVTIVNVWVRDQRRVVCVVENSSFTLRTFLSLIPDPKTPQLLCSHIKSLPINEAKSEG